MKITVYTITDCQFSKLEKEYLSSHGLQFEEKNVATNREFLTEMLAVGSNFAGTPVTKIDGDDGKTVVLKGFTKEEFDKALNFTAAPVQPAVAAPVAPAVEPVVAAPAVQPVPPQPVVAEPVMPAVEPVPVQAAPEMPVVPAPVAAPVQTAPPAADPAMASLLNNLQQQAQNTAPAPAMPPAQPQVGQPVIPDPQF